MAGPISQPLEKHLTGYGCTHVVRLDEKLSTPDQLDYLDLLPRRSNQSPTLAAVAQHQGTALLYVVDWRDSQRGTSSSIAEIRRQLANRSDPAWLGVVRPGHLEVYPIGFHASEPDTPISVIDERSGTAPLFFQGLVHGTLPGIGRPAGTDFVYHKIFDLLTQTTDEFVPKSGKGKIDSLDVLSMAGRALFFRFLIDRRIVLESELSGEDGICPKATELKDAFSSAEKAARTSAWLDATFNGDFLPLIDESIPVGSMKARVRAYRDYYAQIEELVGSSIFNHLHAILRGWRSVGSSFQVEIDWGDLDFAHIPVGVLSQVYESFSRRADPATARETSVHYTPRSIARLMVDEAFAATDYPSEASILDSACGAGIFLVLAFRRLVQERWSRGGRPRTAEIQDILYRQIRGFDISEPALRLAALSLYITAIELNASPRPPRSLKFPRNLRGTVLYRFSVDSNASTQPALGSVGRDVSPDFDATFDIVVGNPPWTRLRDKQKERGTTTAINNEFTKIGKRVLRGRGFGNLADEYENPDKNPDLPFLWRALEWAKPSGTIALAMPARLFGRIAGNGLKAWHSILKSVEVTGIVNGANLRKTAVWEGVDMPFCVLFARNSVPKSGHSFHYAAPHYEPVVNGEGRFRIDYESANAIAVDQLLKRPWLLKTLSLGTWLDVDIADRLIEDPRKSLLNQWRRWDPGAHRTGQGYILAANLKQKPVDFLADLPNFEPSGDFAIDFDHLQPFGDVFGIDENGMSSAHMPRRRELFEGPVVIIPKAPGFEPSSPRAFLSDRPIAFSQSYYGYSCAGHDDPQTLASLIYLLAHSSLFRHFALMISVSQGADHMIFTKQDFDSIRFPEINKLSSSLKAKARSIASEFQSDTSEKPWGELDQLIFDIYGFSEDERQVIEDTLFSSAAYRRAGRSAFDLTDKATRNHFLETISFELEPYFEVVGQQIAVNEITFNGPDSIEPWQFISVCRDDMEVRVNRSLLKKAVGIANSSGCSRIIIEASGKSGIIVGLLNQRRWWTDTRARLCGQHVIREHLHAFGLAEDI